VAKRTRPARSVGHVSGQKKPERDSDFPAMSTHGQGPSTPGGSRRELGRSNSFPPRRHSFDKIWSVIQASDAVEEGGDTRLESGTPSPSHQSLASRSREEGVGVHQPPPPCNPAVKPEYRTTWRPTIAPSAPGKMEESCGPRESRREAGKEEKRLGRSESFPIRRSSFDRIIDLHANDEADEPAAGPHFTSTNTNTYGPPSSHVSREYAALILLCA